MKQLLLNLTLKVPSRLRVLEAKVCQSLRSTHGDVMDVLRDNEATEAREGPFLVAFAALQGDSSAATDQMDMDLRLQRMDQRLQRMRPLLPLLSTSGSRTRSRSPAGKGKDNGKSMDKDKGMDKGKDKGKGMGKGMHKGKDLELLDLHSEVITFLELQRERAVLELRHKMEQVFNTS